MADNNFSVAFKGIKEVSFSTKLSDDILNNFDQKNVDLRIGFSVTGNEKLSSVSINLFIDYRYKSGSGKPKDFFNLETETDFKFKDVSSNTERLIISDEVVSVDDDLMKILLDVSLGATRGIVSYKMANLPIKLVLPLIDPIKLINLNKDRPQAAKK